MFTSTARPIESWPNWTTYPGPASTLDETLLGVVDVGSAPLNDLQRSIIEAIAAFYAHDQILSSMIVNTARDAKKFLEEVEKFRHPNAQQLIDQGSSDY